jgi:P2 family phage major capsid protein
MNELARARFEQEVLFALAQGYGVETVSRQFAIEPTIAQELNDKIVEQSAFLPLINVIGVAELEGENILGFASSPVASRTDTSGDGERKPRDVLGLGRYRYKLAQTNSDTAIRYATIDAWAKFPDLADRYARYIQERIAADRELVGWHGTSVAQNTDLGANPELQDVNKGWMQYMRENLSENILAEGRKVPGKIRIGEGGDYSCLDVAINDLVEGIPYYMQKDLYALAGRDFIVRERAILFEAIQGKPTEKQVMEHFSKLFGGLPWMTPSFFPARGLVITPLRNLSIYHQDTSWRRKIDDNAKKDRYEDFNSRNEGYVVEEPEAFVGIEFANVELPDGDGGWE